jgi:para-aminobenzoate synthetase component 1
LGFRQILNKYGARGEPCVFVIGFDKKLWHCETLAHLSGKLWFHIGKYRFSNPYPKNPNSFFKKPEKYEQYLLKFKAVQEQLEAGNSYLLNLTCKTPLDGQIDLKSLFHTSDAPYLCMLEGNFISFSPERFIQTKDDTIHTYPMKGTIDATLSGAKEQLLQNPKEQSEHVMVVDLLRNDLSMVSSNVRVEKFRYIEEISAGPKRLLQVSSHIKGDLPKNWQANLGDLLDTLLPAGSITGTPKCKTTQIIQDVEGYERGYFTGIFGVFDGVDVDTAVMIRFIEHTKDGFVYKSGGGITLESDPKAEYDEMVDKIYAPMF